MDIARSGWGSRYRDTPHVFKSLGHLVSAAMVYDRGHGFSPDGHHLHRVLRPRCLRSRRRSCPEGRWSFIGPGGGLWFPRDSAMGAQWSRFRLAGCCRRVLGHRDHQRLGSDHPPADPASSFGSVWGTPAAGVMVFLIGSFLPELWPWPALPSPLEELHAACVRGDGPRARRLLQAGIDPDDTIWSGEPLIYIAASACQPSIIELLVEFGANPQASWQMGTAMTIAKRLEDRRTIEILSGLGVQEKAPSSGWCATASYGRRMWARRRLGPL